MVNKTRPMILANNVYFPRRSSADEHLESEKEYRERMKEILPNFPGEVLLQWFYRHCRQDIDDYAWLDYSALQFEKEKWSSEKIIVSGIMENDRVQINKMHFETGVKSRYTDYLESHFYQHHTWPIAPVLLHNPNNNMVLPNGYKCTNPYHPLDGNHRLGVFISLFEKSIINKEEMHYIWIARTNNV